MSDLEINIVAGGPLNDIPNLHTYNEGNVMWVGVDRGTIYLLNENITPYTAVGDFDSITEEEWDLAQKHVKHIEKFRAEKAETDMAIALNWAMKQKPKTIRLFGATGGRLDHLFANVLVLVPLKQSQPQIDFIMIDRQNEMSILLAGHYSINRKIEKKYFSLIPLSETVENLTLKGLKYPLHNRFVQFGSSLCVSNEFIESICTISFTKGILMMVRSED